MRTKTSILGITLLLLCGAASAQERVIGLLTLPQVFGAGPCDEFEPGEIPLYAEPDAGHAVGVIHVSRPWTFHANGGCEGLIVSIRPAGASEVCELPAREYDYEAPAAIVLNRRDDWFEIRLPTGSAWLQASERNEFHSLEHLLTGQPHVSHGCVGRTAGFGAGRSA